MDKAWVVVAALATGCVIPEERPEATIVCHNANCAHATNPFYDDTLAALDDSLALEHDNRPAIDGVEIDTLWDRRRSLCIFAHDFGTAPAKAELGMEAAERVAKHIETSECVSWSGNRFFVKIELKNEVLADGTPHDEAELAAHLDCVFDMADRIVTAARARGVELELGFDSEAVPLLRAIEAHPRWAGKHPSKGLELRLISNVLSAGLEPRDLDSLTGDGEGIDILAFHATRTTTGVAHQYKDLGARLMLWMLDVAPETMDAVKEFEPEYIVTNEALLFRRWQLR